MDIDLNELSIDELHRLIKKAKHVEQERGVLLNQILENKDATQLEAFLNKHAQDLSSITAQKYQQNYHIEDIPYLQILLKAYEYQTQGNSITHNTLLSTYKAADSDSDDEDEQVFITIEEDKQRHEAYGLFYKAFDSLENYQTISQAFPDAFKKFFLSYQQKWEFWRKMNETFVTYLIEHQNLVINAETIKTLANSNRDLFTYFYHQPEYTHLFDAHSMRTFLVSNLDDIEKYYYNEKNRVFFTPENIEFFFNTAWMARSVSLMEKCVNVLGANPINAIKETISNQEQITQLCKGKNDYFSFFMQHIEMTPELFLSFYKPLARSYVRERDSQKNMNTFFNHIKNNSDMLMAFEKKCYLSKKSNPDLWEDMQPLILYTKLHEKLNSEDLKKGSRLKI